LNIEKTHLGYREAQDRKIVCDRLHYWHILTKSSSDRKSLIINKIIIARYLINKKIEKHLIIISVDYENFVYEKGWNFAYLADKHNLYLSFNFVMFDGLFIKLIV
jgi:hypothetical protein